MPPRVFETEAVNFSQNDEELFTRDVNLLSILQDESLHECRLPILVL
jgi:hypothetical protein